MKGLELELSIRQDFPSAQWLSPPYHGQGLIPRCWSRSPEGWADLAVFPLSVCVSLLPRRGYLPQSKGVLKRMGPMWSHTAGQEGRVLGGKLWRSSTIRIWAASGMPLELSTNSGHRCPTQAPPQDQVTSISHSQVFSLVMATPDPVLHCDIE